MSLQQTFLTIRKLIHLQHLLIVGIWIPCAGSVTSWNTHLGSEEYEPDAKNLAANVTYEEFAVMDEGFSAKDITLYLRYFGIYYPTYENDMDLIRSTFNPCEWCHIHTKLACH